MCCRSCRHQFATRTESTRRGHRRKISVGAAPCPTFRSALGNTWGFAPWRHVNEEAPQGIPPGTLPLFEGITGHAVRILVRPRDARVPRCDVKIVRPEPGAGAVPDLHQGRRKAGVEELQVDQEAGRGSVQEEEELAGSVTRLPRHQNGDRRAFYGAGGRYVVEVSTENFR